VHRDLAAHVVVYCVIALALYMQSSREALLCLLGRNPVAAGTLDAIQCGRRIQVSRRREPDWLGSDERRLVSQLSSGQHNGSSPDVADEKDNDEVFGRPGASCGESAYRKIRFVSLVENGAHVLYGSRIAELCRQRDRTGEDRTAQSELANAVRRRPRLFRVRNVEAGGTTGADLLWRVRKNIVLPCDKRLADGSYLSRIYPSQQDAASGTAGVLQPADGALRCQRSDARGRLEGR
jgi:hypothetical protein